MAHHAPTAASEAGLGRREGAGAAAWAAQSEVEALTKEVIDPGVVVVRGAAEATKRPRARGRAALEAGAGPESEPAASEVITDSSKATGEDQETCTMAATIEAARAAETTMADLRGELSAEKAAEGLAESTGCPTLTHLFFPTKYSLSRIHKRETFRLYMKSTSKSMMSAKQRSSLISTSKRVGSERSTIQSLSTSGL